MCGGGYDGRIGPAGCSTVCGGDSDDHIGVVGCFGVRAGGFCSFYCFLIAF